MTKKRYQLQQRDNLLWLSAAVGSFDRRRFVARLLLDTGSSFTVLHSDVLTGLGYDLTISDRRVTIIVASGRLSLPIVQAAWLSLLGQRLENIAIVAHTFPTGVFFDGVLGLDLLNQLNVSIQVRKAQVTLDDE